MKRQTPVIGWVVALLLVEAAPVHAQSLPQLFAQGNAAFFEGDFPDAIAHYTKLLDAGVEDADVYYNLGTAHARLGQCGAAIHAFERSLAISAGDGSAEANLRACQAQLGKRRAQRDGEATVQTRPPWSEAMLRSVSSDALAWIVLCLNVLLFACLLLRRMVSRETARLGLALGAWLTALTLLVGVLALSTKEQWLQEGRGAVVLNEDALLREGPDPRARTRTYALEGERGRILQEEGGFVRVRLARGPEGWMSQRDVGEL